MNRILVVEDNRDIREAIRMVLNANGYEVLVAANGTEGLKQMENSPELIVLDIMMPDISGIEVCKTIRKFSNVPILFLTAKSQISDKVEGLLSGGDDYLVKPFDNEELLVRISALLRRFIQYQGNEKTDIAYLLAGDIKLSEIYNEVYVKNKQVKLPDVEYRMLRLFMKQRNQILSTKQIYEAVWDEPYFYDRNNTVMVHIRNIRVTIEEDPKNPKYLFTEWGRGYRFGN